MDIPEEELHGHQSLNPNWPFQGLIEFRSVTLRYMPSLPAALKDITFTIEGGMQVVIILSISAWYWLNILCFWWLYVKFKAYRLFGHTFLLLIVIQVGIIGRTGAGKSSVLNALFRLTPTCRGCIIVDGINIADVPVRDLRSHFAVVPQSPFLFEGSLRYFVGMILKVNVSIESYQLR